MIYRRYRRLFYLNNQVHQKIFDLLVYWEIVVNTVGFLWWSVHPSHFFKFFFHLILFLKFVSQGFLDMPISIPPSRMQLKSCQNSLRLFQTDQKFCVGFQNYVRMQHRMPKRSKTFEFIGRVNMLKISNFLNGFLTFERNFEGVYHYQKYILDFVQLMYTF